MDFTQHIVIAIVDDPLEGADSVSSTTTAIHLLGAVFDGKSLMAEGDFLVLTNCLTDLPHGSHGGLVRGFVSAHEVHFVLKRFGLIVAAQIFGCRKQMLFPALGDAPGGSDALSQEAKRFKITGEKSFAEQYGTDFTMAKR